MRKIIALATILCTNLAFAGQGSIGKQLEEIRPPIDRFDRFDHETIEVLGQGSIGSPARMMSGQGSVGITNVMSLLVDIAPTLVGHEDYTLVIRGNKVMKTDRPILDAGHTVTGVEALEILQNETGIVLTPAE